MGEGTTIDRRSEREIVVTRLFDGPVRLVFEAWTTPDLMMLWWAPRSAIPLLSCEMDVRVGGKYRLAFGRDGAPAMTFFGTYIDVTPPSRLVWTNDESGGDPSVTTVTFEDEAGRTRLVLHELHPSKEALDAAIAGMADGMSEQFQQLDALLATLPASA